MEHLYHATDINNLDSILNEDLKMGIDGCVYLADSPENALKFMAFRPYTGIVVFEIDASKLNPDKLDESFDHNENFFKCKAWAYYDDISSYLIESYTEYKKKEEK